MFPCFWRNNVLEGFVWVSENDISHGGQNRPSWQKSWSKALKMKRFGFRPKNGNFGAPKLQSRVFESKMVDFGPNGPILLARGGFNLIEG